MTDKIEIVFANSQQSKQMDTEFIWLVQFN